MKDYGLLGLCIPDLDQLGTVGSRAFFRGYAGSIRLIGSPGVGSTRTLHFGMPDARNAVHTTGH